jgi:MYXO-CTERM domain-containing protein
MSARTISRLARTGIAAGALTVALSAPALAVPARDTPGDPTANTSGAAVTTADGRPVPTPPTWPENPQPLIPPQTVAATTDAGFQWDDAGIGAGGALAIVALAGLGGAFVLRRRHQADPPIAA